MADLKKNKIFNPEGDDTIANRTIIKGDITGLFNLGDVKYNWAKQMYQVIMRQFMTVRPPNPSP